MNLNQVTLPAVDVAPAAAFYQRLGLRLIVDALPRYVRFECPDGESTLSLEQVPERGAEPGPVVYFECEHLDQTVERLRAAGDPPVLLLISAGHGAKPCVRLCG